MNKIVISNCWSYYNKGDAAITYGTINVIEKKYPNAKISILSFDDKSFQDRKELKNIIIHKMPTLYAPLNLINRLMIIICYIFPNMTDIFGLLYIKIQTNFLKVFRYVNQNLDKCLRDIDEADLIISVGGNYLWSHQGLFNHLVPIIYSKEVKNKKVIFYGQSIGPFNNNPMKLRLIKLFNKIDGIYLREELSLKYLQNDLKINNDILFSLGDIAFFVNKNEQIEEKEESKKICITVRPWLFNEPELNNRYITSIKEVINFLVTNYDYSVSLLPFSYTIGKEYDFNVCQLIYSNLSNGVKQKTSIMNIKEKSPVEIVNYLKEKNYVIMIGTRLHSVILSSLAGIPSVIISYQHFKALGISKQLGLENYVIKIEDIDTYKLIALTVNLLNERNNAKKVLINSINRIRENIELNSNF